MSLAGSQQAAHAVRMSAPDRDDPELFDELMAEVERVARSGAFTLGEEVECFEHEFAAYCGAAHAVGVSSGTEALELSLRALGVGPGDEVVVPANSFIATAEAVSLAGATPRLADVDPATALLTRERVEVVMSSRTRCIIPVHLYGRTVELGPILDLARETGVAIVEDAAQAHGASLQDRRAGALGACGCFSFYPAKNLGAWGDAGAVVTGDPELADRLRLMRAHGERPRYHHNMLGKTARLDALQAAVLRVKLRRLDGWNARRRDLARALTEGIAGSAVLPPPAPAPAGDHVYHQYVVRTDDRDGLREQLDREGIDSGVHYPVPVHLTPAFAWLGKQAGDLPNTERLASGVCSLPVHPGVRDADVERMIAAVRAFEPATPTGEGARVA